MKYKGIKQWPWLSRWHGSVPATHKGAYLLASLTSIHEFARNVESVLASVEALIPGMAFFSAQRPQGRNEATFM